MPLADMPRALKEPFEALGAAAHKAGIFLDPEQCYEVVSRMYDENARLRTFDEIMGIRTEQRA